MTGRDLIIYILENHLENEPIYDNGKVLGFITPMEAAAKFGVGLETVLVWIHQGSLDFVRIGDRLYIPMNAKRPERVSMSEGSNG